MPQGNFCFFLAVTLFIHNFILMNESVEHLTRGQRIRSHSTRSIWSVFYDKSIEGEISNLSLGLLVSVEVAGLFSFPWFLPLGLQRCGVLRVSFFFLS